jgi:hypothetical protein
MFPFVCIIHRDVLLSIVSMGFPTYPSFYGFYIPIVLWILHTHRSMDSTYPSFYGCLHTHRSMESIHRIYGLIYMHPSTASMDSSTGAYPPHLWTHLQAPIHGIYGLIYRRPSIASMDSSTGAHPWHLWTHLQAPIYGIHGAICTHAYPWHLRTRLQGAHPWHPRSHLHARIRTRTPHPIASTRHAFFFPRPHT